MKGARRKIIASLFVTSLAAWSIGHVLADDRLELFDVDAGAREGILLELSDGEVKVFRKRGRPKSPQERQNECPSRVYLELGSGSYVRRAVEEERARLSSGPSDRLSGRALKKLYKKKEKELRERRAAMGYGDPTAFLAAWPDERTNDDGVPDGVKIDCNLVLLPSDLIYTRLEFIGADSSNVHLDCRCEDGPQGQCARIVNPFTLKQMDDFENDQIMGGEPAMLTFRPARCGLNRIEETGEFVDAIGAIAPSCDPVTGVKVSRCEIHGRITARSFSGDMALYSSPRADHVQRLRASAAQHLTFSEVKIIGQYRTPVHMLPGVHHVTVEDSQIRGGQYYSTVYLPADGGFNSLINNEIWGQSVTWDADLEKPRGSRREAIAIDSSEHNRIINNRFKRMPYGGIFLFRNCGERSMIRHRPAQYNQIINNVFDFGGNDPGHPTVHIGSRDDDSLSGWGVKSYCDKDLAPGNSPYMGNQTRFPWDLRVFPNSSLDNGDWAGQNVVAQNVFTNYGSRDFRDPGSFVELSRAAQDLDNNVVFRNNADPDLSSALQRQSARPSGCAVVHEDASGRDLLGIQPFILHGSTVDMYWKPDRRINLECGPPLVCVDGELRESRARGCRIRKFEKECFREHDNAGCSRVSACQVGSRLVGVQAACNLEDGRVTDPQLGSVPPNRVQVFRASDNKDEGHCRVNGLDIAEGGAWLSAPTRDDVSYGCSEHDGRDGGDCHIRVNYYCRQGNR